MSAERKVDQANKIGVRNQNRSSSETLKSNSSKTSLSASTILSGTPEESEHSICEHCGTKQSPVWRKGEDEETLCNACGLYLQHNGSYRPLLPSSNRKSSQSKDLPAGWNGQPEIRRAPERESRKKNKSGFQTADSTAIQKVKRSRKSAVPSKISQVEKMSMPAGTLLKLCDGQRWLASLDYQVPSTARHVRTKVKYSVHRGRTFFQGDHCAIQAANGEIYFVLVKDFYVDIDGTPLFSFTWLLPKLDLIAKKDQNEPLKILDPTNFTIGPDYPEKEPLDLLLFVFYSPSTLPKPLAEFATKLLSPTLSAPTDSRSLGKDPSSPDMNAAESLCELGL